MSNVARQYQLPKEKKQQVQQQKPVTPKVRKKITKGEKGIIAMMFLAFTCAVLFFVVNQVSTYAVNRDIHVLEQSILQQEQVNDGLRLQVIELSRPDRILDIATEELGMSLDDNKVKVIQN
ncbi:cell division protein FtsL [Bacillus alkalicellulosilyticus]|uniref:cell division protein FtsL n=1 Tax=Alkalihalobacterium alkalicellulosilyticum TaxID=1912214 RepID=UPI0009963E3B|nr:cell division protein FtsL [Bacillus alkalicellulosilyticus]